MFFRWRRRSANPPDVPASSEVDIRVVGVGGGGGNAVRRMAAAGLQGVKYLVLNTDVQAMKQLGRVHTFAIGPEATAGMGSGGQMEVGRKAMRESSDQVSRILDGADMVFIAAGMGGGTGTGAAPLVADIARKKGALTVGVVTLPFGFEGPRRRTNALHGIRQLRKKVDTLITVENDRLLPALDGQITLDRAFQTADEVLRQGVQGISDIVTVDGLINVDFADVKTVVAGRGSAFMATGSGVGRNAATDAANAALANPLFDTPLSGATGVLFNVTGGPDLTLGEVHEVADLIREAASSNANVIFGVAHDRRRRRSVSITLVGTGIDDTDDQVHESDPIQIQEVPAPSPSTPVASRNGGPAAPLVEVRPML